MNADELRELGKEIEAKLNAATTELYGQKVGFCLLVFPFYAPGISNYMSNAAREDMITALRETADRLEKQEDRPRNP